MSSPCSIPQDTELLRVVLEFRLSAILEAAPETVDPTLLWLVVPVRETLPFVGGVPVMEMEGGEEGKLLGSNSGFIKESSFGSTIIGRGPGMTNRNCFVFLLLQLSASPGVVLL